MVTILASDTSAAFGLSVEPSLDPGHRRRPMTMLSSEERAIYDRIPDKCDHMPNPMYAAKDAEEKFSTQPLSVAVPEWFGFPEAPEGIPRHAKGRAALSSADEVALFHRYNYARYRLSHLADMQEKHPSTPRARQMIRWFQRAMSIRALLVRANLRLVLAMITRSWTRSVELDELIAEGNMALLRSIDKFDVSRGFKFSTYACRSILKAFCRLAAKTHNYRRFFPVTFDPDLEESDDTDRKREMQRQDTIDALRECLARNYAKLSDLERKVVSDRFAIESRGKGKTLAQMGKMMALTKERVRQIERAALGKIGAAFEERLAAV